MKKVVALLLTAVMLIGLLTACGGSSSSSTTTSANSGSSAQAPADGVEKVNLKVWIPEEELEITQKLTADFAAAHPEYDITFDISITGIDLSANGLETDPELAADVFQLPSGSIAQLTNAGLLLPITYNMDAVKALYGEGALAACYSGDYMYGVPFSPNSWFMFYNKSLYTEDEVKSLDTMFAKDLGEGVYNFSCDLTNSWYLEAFFYATGCTLFGADGTDPTDCTWNTQAGVDAANYVMDMIANPKYLEEADGIAGSMMKDGKLGALCSGTWSAPDLMEALGDDFGAVALPTITVNGKTCQLSNFADYKVWSVKSNTKNALAAQLLAQYLAGPEAQIMRYQASKATPTVLALMDNAEIASDIATTALIAQTQFATPQPSIAQINNYWTPVQALGEEMISGAANPGNIQEKLDRVVADILTNLT